MDGVNESSSDVSLGWPCTSTPYCSHPKYMESEVVHIQQIENVELTDLVLSPVRCFEAILRERVKVLN